MTHSRLMPRFDVYGLGNALLDMEFSVDDVTLKQLEVDKGLMTLIEEARHHTLLEALGDLAGGRGSGGSACNTVIAAAHLGCNAFYTCKVADDEAGHYYRKDLIGAGVKTNLDRQPLETGLTGKCIVLTTPDAERSMSTYLGITKALSERELDLEALRDAALLYIEGYLVAQPPATQAAILARETAQAQGITTALTLSDENMVRYFRDNLSAIIGEGLDLVFSNEDEARLMFAADSIEACVAGMRGIAKRFAITRGAQGATLFDGAKTIDVAAPTVKALDTNGAGDLYAGTFLTGLTRGLPFERCGEFAAATSARLVTHYGARLPADELQAIGKRYAS